jgi:hypothetical protein
LINLEVLWIGDKVMKKRLFLTGIVSLGLAFVLVFTGCPTDAGSGGGGGGGDATVTTKAIPGVTAPKTGDAPVTTITATDQYTGTVTWEPTATTFATDTEYTATITLTAKDGYTFTGVEKDFFTVTGATVTNDADSGVVKAKFPKTSTTGTTVDIAAIGGVTAPKTGEIPVTAITETEQYTGEVKWDLAAGATTFAADTTYTATITLVVKGNYTFTGVEKDFFKVAGATTVTNAADSGVVTAVFPKTSPGLKILPASTALEVGWPKSGDLDKTTDYYVRYKSKATNDKDLANSTEVSATDIKKSMDSFTVEIKNLVNDVEYTVWVFKQTDSATYTTATPLFMGKGTPVGPTKVTLGSKSHGTADAGSITGLESSAKYVVKEGNSWYPIANTGGLGSASTLDGAVSSTISSVTKITNLDNTKTYDVYLIKTFTDDDGTLSSTDTGSKNTVADIKALVTAGKKFTVTTTQAGATVLVFTNVANAAAIDKNIAKDDVIGGAKSYKVTDIAGGGTIKIKAAADAKYAEIDLTGAVDGSSVTFTVQ